MPIFTCDKCFKEFDHRSKYNRHLERIRSCVKKKNISGSKTTRQVINNICKHCKREFSRKDSLARHLNTCKYKTVTKKNIIKGEKNTSGKKNIVAIDSKNCNNNNNNKTYNIILNFGTSATNDLSRNDIISFLKSNTGVIEKFIEITNFNPNKPQHHNVYYPDIKSGYGIIYKDKKWTKKRIHEIVSKLLDSKVEDLNTIVNELSDCLNEKSIKKIKDAIKDADFSKPGTRKKLISYIKPILYENKDMIIKTRKSDNKEYSDIFNTDVSPKDIDKALQRLKKKNN
ncbi:zinc finger domain-containing protein [Moumouvirus maliensis]|nr:zinc finger domain-containing protein [Moumouvirus maliensis]